MWVEEESTVTKVAENGVVAKTNVLSVSCRYGKHERRNKSQRRSGRCSRWIASFASEVLLPKTVEEFNSGTASKLPVADADALDTTGDWRYDEGEVDV